MPEHHRRGEVGARSPAPCEVAMCPGPESATAQGRSTNDCEAAPKAKTAKARRLLSHQLHVCRTARPLYLLDDVPDVPLHHVVQVLIHRLLEHVILRGRSASQPRGYGLKAGKVLYGACMFGMLAARGAQVWIRARVNKGKQPLVRHRRNTSASDP